MTHRKYDSLIDYSMYLNAEEKDMLNTYYEKTFEILGIHYETKPLLLKQLAIYIVRYVWEKKSLEEIEKLIDDWFHYYENEFVNYTNSFVLICDEFDLNKSFALKFITEKAP